MHNVSSVVNAENAIYTTTNWGCRMGAQCQSLQHSTYYMLYICICVLNYMYLGFIMSAAKTETIWQVRN